MQNVIQIVGTTGVGKSLLSIEIAKALNGEIINSDSMQIYTGLDIITNKHPVNERDGVPHHLLGFLDYKEEYRIGTFERDASLLIERLHETNKLPIVVGGTAYYATSLVFQDMLHSMKEQQDASGGDHDHDCRLQKDTAALYADLQKLDPQMAARWHPRDHRKIRRSLELFYETGKPQSLLYAEQRETGRLQAESVKYRTLFLWLWADQQVLDERLDLRIEKMIGSGLIQEIQDMYTAQLSTNSDGHGFDFTKGIFQAIGYKEFIPYLQSGSEADLQSGMEAMKAATRRYARKQIKWIRNKLLLQCQQAGSNVQVVVLDATNLSAWKENVAKLGMQAVKDFLDQSHNFDPMKYCSTSMQPLLVPTNSIELSSNPKAWQSWTCELCKIFSTNTVEGKQIHLQSRAHKTKIVQAKKREAFEEWKRLQQQIKGPE